MTHLQAANCLDSTSTWEWYTSKKQKYVEKYNKSHFQNVINKNNNKSHLQSAFNKNNYHNNSLPYSVPAILQATSTLNPGNHVLAIFKTFIFLCHLHLSLFNYLPKFLTYKLYIHVTVHRKRVFSLNNQPDVLIVHIYSVVCRMYSRKPWWIAEKMLETCRVLWQN